MFLRPLRDKLRATHILIKEHLVNKKPFEDTTLKGIVHKIITYHESRIGDNA